MESSRSILPIATAMVWSEEKKIKWEADARVSVNYYAYYLKKGEGIPEDINGRIADLYNEALPYINLEEEKRLDTLTLLCDLATIHQDEEKANKMNQLYISAYPLTTKRLFKQYNEILKRLDLSFFSFVADRLANQTSEKIENARLRVENWHCCEESLLELEKLCQIVEKSDELYNLISHTCDGFNKVYSGFEKENLHSPRGIDSPRLLQGFSQLLQHITNNQFSLREAVEDQLLGGNAIDNIHAFFQYGMIFSEEKKDDENAVYQDLNNTHRAQILLIETIKKGRENTLIDLDQTLNEIIESIKTLCNICEVNKFKKLTSESELEESDNVEKIKLNKHSLNRSY